MTQWKESYDKQLQAVSRAIDNLDRPGGCFVSGAHASFPLPGLTVDSIGVVPLPLTDTTAKALVDKCHLAPYGHGEKTIVDTSVRNTWELNASQLQLQNSQWATFMDAILRSCREPLGISAAANVEAKLYKLLLYEEGGKFERHQDSEKEVGMFGTLVVVLPSQFEGGELIVYPPSASKQDPHVWNPSEMNVYDLKYAAFYGDCAHEVKPVTSGYRLCLTYNLVTTTVAEMSRFAGNRKLHSALESSLHEYFGVASTKRRRVSESGSHESVYCTPPTSSRQFVYLVEHEYTSQGLTFDFLKNKDMAIAQSLAEFCRNSNGAFNLYLCKLKYTKVTDPECDDEEIEKSVALKGPWRKHGEDKSISCPDMEVELTEEVAPVGILEDVEFDDGETEYTGNEGAREEHWYHAAALVIQSATRELEQAAAASISDAALKWVDLVAQESPDADKFAQIIFSRQREWTSTSSSFVSCLGTVLRVNDVDLFEKLLRSLSNYSFQPLLANAVEHFGWDECFNMLASITHSSRMSSRVNLVCSVLDGVTDAMKAARVFRELGNELVPRLSFSSYTPYTVYSQFSGYQEKAYNDPADPCPQTYGRLLAIACRTSSLNFIPLKSVDDLKTLINLLAPAMVECIKTLDRDPSGNQLPAELLQHIRDKLHANVPTVRNLPFSTTHVKEHCDKCIEVQRFLRAASESSLTLPVKNKTQMNHMHTVAKRANLDARPNGATEVTLIKRYGSNKLLYDATSILAVLDGLVRRPSSAPSATSGAVPAGPSAPHLPPVVFNMVPALLSNAKENDVPLPPNVVSGRHRSVEVIEIVSDSDDN